MEKVLLVLLVTFIFASCAPQGKCAKFHRHHSNSPEASLRY
jgi:hypothetical protein